MPNVRHAEGTETTYTAHSRLVYNTVKKRNEENEGKEQLNVRKAEPELDTKTAWPKSPASHTGGCLERIPSTLF